MLDSFLEKLGNLLQNTETRKQLARRISRIVRNLFLVITIFYAGILLLLPLLASWIGENNITLAFWLYLPRAIALLPLPILFLITLFINRKIAILQIAAGLAFFTFGMGYEWRGNSTAPFDQPNDTNMITALTYNRGQHANQSLQPFIDLTNPDIIALQESPGRAKGYLADSSYSQFKHASSVGEHTFLSRYPILSEELIHLGDHLQDNTPAGRFVIDFQGKHIAVYSVHYITVRDTLSHYRQGAFLYGVIGIIPGTPFHRKMKINQSFWDERILTAATLKKAIDQEILPTLVLGDFNAPAGGYIHKQMKHGLQDSHEVAGKGCGYSFPGTTRNPLSLGGPWVRIDYIFASKHWNVISSLTEEERTSQHRAVATKLSLNR